VQLYHHLSWCDFGYFISQRTQGRKEGRRRIATHHTPAVSFSTESHSMAALYTSTFLPSFTILPTGCPFFFVLRGGFFKEIVRMITRSNSWPMSTCPMDVQLGEWGKHAFVFPVWGYHSYEGVCVCVNSLRSTVQA